MANTNDAHMKPILIVFENGGSDEIHVFQNQGHAIIHFIKKII